MRLLAAARGQYHLLKNMRQYQLVKTSILLLLTVAAGQGLSQTAHLPGGSKNSLAATRADTTQYAVVIETDGQIAPQEVYAGIGLAGPRYDTRLPVQELIAGVQHWLASQGYFLARVDSVRIQNGAAPRLAFRVHEGGPLRLQAVRMRFDTTGGELPVARLREWPALRRAKDPSTLQKRIEAFVDELAEFGFPFASVSVDSVFLIKNGGYGLALTAQPGRQVRIDSIFVQGNTVTRSQVILRELPVKPGQLYRESRVRAVPERLMRLGYFKQVREPELLLAPDGKGLLKIGIVEGNSNTINGVAGYNPGAGSQPGYLTGLLDLKFGNLLGTGRVVIARWEKRSRETQELALRYREPWLLGYPVHLEGGFQQRIQDTLYVDRMWDLQAEWPIIENMHLLGQVKRSSISPDSLGSVLFAIPKSRTTAAAVGLTYNSTDDPVNPRQGAWYTTLLETSNKRVFAADSGGTFNQRKLSVDLNLYQPLWRFQVLALGLHGRQVTSNEPIIPITDQYRFGGATTLRGYREEQFRGSRIAWGNLEYRYLFSRRGRAFVFFDFGYFFRQEPAEKIEKVKTSYGLGVRIDTRLGIIGVDYGLGEGDGLMQGKVHVSLVNSF